MIKTAIILIIIGGIALLSPVTMLRIVGYILPRGYIFGITIYDFTRKSVDNDILHKSGAAIIVRILGAILFFLGAAELMSKFI